MATRKRQVRFNEGSDDDSDDGAKRKRTELPEADEDEDAPKKAAAIPKHKGKHSIDSDEESAEEEEEGPKASTYALTDEDMHEDLDAAFTDGGVEVTPFNLKREMEEGHFDEAGNYFLDKDANAGDEWLEGVTVYKGKVEDDEDEDDDEPPPVKDRTQLMEALLMYLQPKESVTQALRRLGNEANKKVPCDDPKKSGADLLRLTAAADAMLGAGCFDVYQYTYEKLAFEIERLRQAKSEGRLVQEPDKTAAESVMFEYKWSNDDGAEVYGPFSAQQMMDWREQGAFQDTVVCREVGKGNAPFYQISRVDFDLYT